MDGREIVSEQYEYLTRTSVIGKEREINRPHTCPRQRSAVEYSTVQYNTIQCNAVKYSKVKYSAFHSRGGRKDLRG